MYYKVIQWFLRIWWLNLPQIAECLWKSLGTPSGFASGFPSGLSQTFRGLREINHYILKNHGITYNKTLLLLFFRWLLFYYSKFTVFKVFRLYDKYKYTVFQVGISIFELKCICFNTFIIYFNIYFTITCLLYMQYTIYNKYWMSSKRIYMLYSSLLSYIWLYKYVSGLHAI